MMNNLEKRYSYSFADNAQYRAQVTPESNSRHVRGYGIVFNQKSKIITEWISDKQEWRSFWEIIAPTALDSILNNGFDTVMDVNHSFNEILARITSKTLTLTKDERGILYEFDAPETSRGEDVLQMIRRGDYYESSFMFVVADGGDEWTIDETTGLYIRTISKIETLYDMAICTYRGAYDNTSIENTIKESTPRIFEYEKEDIEVASRKLNDLYSNSSIAGIDSQKRKFNEDFITRIYLKRNWERRKISQENQ